MVIVRRLMPWPFLAGNCDGKPIYSINLGANLNGGSEDLHRLGGKIAESGTSTDVNRRHLGFMADSLPLRLKRR